MKPPAAPLFSVITVCRNSVRVLPRAMASLSQQCYANFEWVVVDGASRDGTPALAATFRRAPLNLCSEPDAGIYPAMNKAVARSRGEYLYFLNSDDQFHGPQVLLHAAGLIAAHGRPDLLIGRVVTRSPGQRALRAFDHLGPRTLLFDSLCHQAVFARGALFERHGGFDTTLALAADFDWLARVMRAGASVRFVDLVVADFEGGGAHMRQRERTQQENLIVRRRHAAWPERAAVHAWTWSVHKARRLLGWPARGRQTVLRCIEGGTPPAHPRHAGHG